MNKELSQVGEAILNSMNNEPEKWPVQREYRFERPSLTFVRNKEMGVTVYLNTSLLYWYDSVWMDSAKSQSSYHYLTSKCLYPERINRFDHRCLRNKAWELYRASVDREKAEERRRENEKLGIVEVVKL